MSWLWTTDALVAATGGRPVGNLPEGVTGISIDSRSLEPGEAFFAIKGDAMDGHDFITAAMKAGAGLVVVAEGKLAGLGQFQVPKIVVPDVLAALEKLGVAARDRAKGKIVAVTGSAGKTSTKEALRHGLSACGTVHASDKSFNNHWGVPLTLARMPEDVDFAVFEIGMNHPGEIRPLVKMVRPHVAMITLIAAAHLGHFKDLDEIAQAKAEIFEGVAPDGAALLNHDDAHWKMLDRLARAAGVKKVVSFGEYPGSTYRLVEARLHADHSTIAASIGGKEYLARVGAPGRHMAQNALAALGVADLVGASVPSVALALSDLKAEEGRGRRHSLKVGKGAFTLIDESYNANPASMKAALSLLKSTPVGEGGRRIAVLGDMLELGAHAKALHAGLAELIAEAGVDHVFLAGPEMTALDAALGDAAKHDYRADAGALSPLVLENIRAGDAVVVKSSKGIGFSKIVAAMLKQFPAEAGDAKPT